MGAELEPLADANMMSVTLPRRKHRQLRYSKVAFLSLSLIVDVS